MYCECDMTRIVHYGMDMYKCEGVSGLQERWLPSLYSGGLVADARTLIMDFTVK